MLNAQRQNCYVRFIYYYNENVFYIYLGTKSDLRIPNSEKFVTFSEGKKLKQKIRASAFVECSAKKKQNLEEVFYEAVRAVEKKPHVKTHQCTLF